MDTVLAWVGLIVGAGMLMAILITLSGLNRLGMDSMLRAGASWSIIAGLVVVVVVATRACGMRPVLRGVWVAVGAGFVIQMILSWIAGRSRRMTY